MLPEGHTFAHYVIEAPIGEGGMGAVYRAFDQKLRRKVALKVIHPDLAAPDAAARLVREARAAAALTHPNTIAIHDLGEIDGTVYLVMELILGVPLRAYVGDATVSVTRKLRWLVDMARGLGAAHKAGLVHRDVKPTNVMVSDDGVVKVLDFGLAKPLEASSFHTDVGLVVGTPRYMAPELFTGMRADARSDQYAFGVTAYELLAGVHPGNATGPVPAALDTLVPDVGPAVARIIARTLSRVPTERFASMSEVAMELEEHIFATRVSGKQETSPATRREGVAGPPSAALALAPTELPASASRLSGARPSGARSAGALSTGSRSTGARSTRSPASAAASSEPASRGSGAIRVVALLGVLAAVGAYGASRFFAASGAPKVSGAELASTPFEAPTSPVVIDPEAAAPEAVEPEPETAPEPESPDAEPEPAAAAGGAEPDDAAPPPQRLPLDDFEDPWAKPAPVDPAP